MNETKPPNPVLVTGMHRSGTSMATRLLNLCGLHLGDPWRLLGAHSDNPQGFWENLDIVTLDDRILARMNAAWDRPPTGAPNPAAALAVFEEFQTPAIACVTSCAASAATDSATGASEATRVWGWKDPRGSLLLPFWSRVVPHLKVVICLRDPHEVAASLSKRNGFSTQTGLLLWRQYNERLEQDLQAAPGMESIVTHYETLLAHPERELGRLIDWLDWPVAPETITEACATIKPELRHHRQGRGPATETNDPEGLFPLYDRLCERAGRSVYPV